MGGGRDTALVLGGGGLTGVGWESGILCGLARAGADLSRADLVVGTSAGSLVGAQLTSGLLTPEELYESQLGDGSGEAVARFGAGLVARYALAMARSRDATAYRRRVGAMALAAAGGADESERREVLAARLVSHEWPERRLVVTAVDALSGELAAFDRESGAGLVDAVSASCAVPGVWPPVTVGQRRFIDGGIRSATNADLAAGYARVVIIAPMTLGSGLVPSPAARAARLRAARGAGAADHAVPGGPQDLRAQRAGPGPAGPRGPGRARAGRGARRRGRRGLVRPGGLTMEG
ncbi:patatin-like phospholipase family protein [Streptomyces goshikiensis]